LPSRWQNAAVSFDAGVRFFSLLALTAGAGAVLLVLARLVPPGRAVVDAMRDASVWLASLVAAVAMAGSLWFSEGQDLVPCTLCWYQRIAMFSLAVILLVGALRRDHGVRWYAVPVAAIGLVISAYHYLLEWNPQWEGTSCDITAPCSTPYFREFEFVSLAFMALCGFAAILALLLAVPVDRGRAHVDSDEESGSDAQVADALR
jgi:disulfide bond formation protein DsbB